MSITKYKVIKNNLEAVINYAQNGEKTEHGILVSGINCLPQKAYSQMMLIKKNFHKENGRLGYHIIQSFSGNEISPEECNRIGMELAQNLWGDKYQVLVCTHTNKNNVHNHIILNSVSFIDGSKYHNSNVEIALLKETNDDICIKYGLSVVESYKANKQKEILKSRIKNFYRNEGKMELIKSNINDAIKNAKKYQDFIDILSFKGYHIKKSGISLSVSTPYYNRNIRLARAFGEEYTFDNIKYRIYYNETYPISSENDKSYKIYESIKIDSVKLKTSSFYRLYVHYLYLLGKLPPKIHYEEKSKEYYREINKFNKLCDELNLFSTHNLNSIEDVQNLRIQYIERISPLKAQKEKYIKLYNQTEKEAEKTILKEKITKLTENINKLNSNIQTCKRIIYCSEKGTKENWLIQKRQENNIQKNEKENNKFRNDKIYRATLK